MEYSIVFDITPSNMLGDGELYIKSIKTKDLTLNEILKNKNLVKTFDDVVMEAIRESQFFDTNLSNDFKSNEFINFFKKHQDAQMEIVIMQQSGLVVKDTDTYENYSIMCIKIKDNIFIGFLINKFVAELLMKKE